MGWAQAVTEQLRDQAHSRAQAVREQGNIAAQGARERGQIWGGAVSQLGQIAASVPQQIAQAKAGETQRKMADVEMAVAKGKLADQERTRVEQQQLRGIFQKHAGDIDGAIDELMGVNPTVGLELHKQQMAAKEQAFKYREESIKAKQAEVGFFGQIAGSVTDQASYTRGLYTAQQAGLDVSQFPADYEQAKGQLETIKRGALTVKEQLDAEFKKIDDERAAAAAKETARHNLASEQTAATDKTADNTRLDAGQKETMRHNRAMEARPVGGSGQGTGVDIKEVVAGMKDGTLPPQLPGRASKEYSAMLAEAHRQGFDLARAATDWQATQKHVATLNGAQQTRMAQAIDNASHSLDVIEGLAKEWDGGKFPILNRVMLSSAKNGALGPKAQQIATKLEAQIADVTSELANVYMGGNSPTDHALTLAAKNLSADWTKDQLRSALDLSRKNLTIRANSMKNVGVAGASPTNPYAPTPAPTVTPTLRYNPATGKVEPIK